MDSAVLTAVASPRRRNILRCVWHDERPAGEIHAAMADVTFGAVSQHLRSLADAGLVVVRAEGRCRITAHAGRRSARSAGCWKACGPTRCRRSKCEPR